jgi:hypothetical protein
MPSVLAKAKSPPPRSPERQKLAEVIERLQAASKQRTALATALQTAEAAVLAANAAVTEAEGGIEAAMEATSAHLVAVAAGNDAADPPRTLRQARIALQDAEDQRDELRRQRDALRRQRDADDQLDHLEIYKMQLREAAAAVLKSEWQGKGDTLVTEITTALPALIEQAELVRRLADTGLFPSARNSLNHIVGPVGVACRLPDADLIPDADKARAAGAARFKQMFEVLQLDPDAPLP